LFHNKQHPINESGLQKAVKKAAKLAGINKPVNCHTFRHCFAYTDVSTTMIYTHVLNQGGMAVRSPMD